MPTLDANRTLSCHRGAMTALLVLVTGSLACGDGFGLDGFFEDGETDGGDGDGDGDPTGEGTGDGDGDDGANGPCELDCGLGTCVLIDAIEYCECPEDSAWSPDGCEPCPVADPTGYGFELPVLTFDGRFRIGGIAPPKSEYDDANLWLENPHTGDRVWLGNSHDEQFAVRVTPGFYDVVYEVETPGPMVPHNSRVVVSQVPLWTSQTQDIDIPVVGLGGAILLDGETPPVSEYDDAWILFRHVTSGIEVAAANTHDGSYAINLVPGTYEVVYRVETPGPVTPRNDGAVLETLELQSSLRVHPIEITSVSLTGAFEIGGIPAPADEYNDGTIELASEIGGVVQLGNTHDGSYAVKVIPGSYTLGYRHETGANVPQNHHAIWGLVDAASGGNLDIDVPMVSLSGALTINGAAPPASEFDDGIVSLRVLDSDDLVPLANTHDGSYQVNVVTGTYAVYYAQETAGAVVPGNKQAQISPSLVVDLPATVDIEIPTVAITGSFTLSGEIPPTSEYDNGRVFLRNLATGDAVLLGSTHEGGYSATVIPGDYEVFYTQETGGEQIPSNQNASLGPITVAAAMSYDVDVPVVALSGQVTIAGEPAPNAATDGGQIYLRAATGDSVLLGDSFAANLAANLVAGTYGVYYRSEASVTMPQNENGRFACVTVE